LISSRPCRTLAAQKIFVTAARDVFSIDILGRLTTAKQFQGPGDWKIQREAIVDSLISVTDRLQSTYVPRSGREGRGR
jgi:hypothetical protein